ncbi:hypothetical protein BDQ12DRAFT_599128 [Crucibulum laeve]|uniref:Uncharacterized protein n=1 Tax=Crucibulum laeve TaxID=68775 RepID=A0A5C3MA70_9AGAR|nr:hypothetical protein BDQ12DRAFT_599128 [Crucibulum laeve]
MLWYQILGFIGLVALEALGNTEIINFAASEAPNVEVLTAGWPILSPNNLELIMNTTALKLGTDVLSLCNSPESIHYKNICPQALWVVLDLDSKEWSSYSKFTLRLSWPASFPLDIAMRIYTPEEVDPTGSPAAESYHKTRRKFARILVTHTGVPIPNAGEFANEKPFSPIPIVVILEPLLFGVLPESLVPTVLFIILAIAASSLTIRPINQYLKGIAAQARTEISLCRNKAE